MRLLLVEDDLRIAAPLSEALGEAGYEVTHCADALSGLQEGLSGLYPVMVLDVMLPGLGHEQDGGFELARRLRDAGNEAALVFLTARGEVQDRVSGLDIGADAYLVKPFETPELLATLRATLRKGSVRSALLAFGSGRGLLDTSARTVRWDGAEVAVTGREYALLETLLHGRGRWFTREELLSRVWGLDFGGEARIVDVYVRYLRRKLAPEAIQSERGRGYRAPDDRPSAERPPENRRPGA
ncbi:response regulator transcription factor [Deinococcus altitudinis]|uniref:response regulator transcription factor n=1 Tax=Deinococcus altitudinis TaxID=468914 RepID=UPI0038929066